MSLLLRDAAKRSRGFQNREHCLGHMQSCSSWSKRAATRLEKSTFKAKEYVHNSPCLKIWVLWYPRIILVDFIWKMFFLVRFQSANTIFLWWLHHLTGTLQFYAAKLSQKSKRWGATQLIFGGSGIANDFFPRGTHKGFPWHKAYYIKICHESWYVHLFPYFLLTDLPSCLSTWQPIYSPICLSNCSTCLSICLFVCLSFCISI